MQTSREGEHLLAPIKWGELPLLLVAAGTLLFQMTVEKQAGSNNPTPAMTRMHLWSQKANRRHTGQERAMQGEFKINEALWII